MYILLRNLFFRHHHDGTFDETELYKVPFWVGEGTRELIRDSLRSESDVIYPSVTGEYNKGDSGWACGQRPWPTVDL